MYVNAKKRRLTLSSYSILEGRRLLAGNVTVFENVNLYIRGDQADNQFEIAAMGEQLEIKGLNGTTINGQDSYVVAGATVTESGVSFSGGLRAHLGPGNDDFAVLDAQFESMSLVYGGTGDDKVDFIDSRFMDRATIQTFDGDDSVSTRGSHFEDTFFAITLDGEDSVSMIDSTMNGNSIVSTGNHSDSIHSEDNHYMGGFNLILPLDGNDSVQLNNPTLEGDRLGVFLGNGDDTINGDLSEATVAGTIRIGGQAGDDEAPEMEMNDQAAENTLVATIESMQVFDGGVGGAANIEGGQDTLLVESTNDGYRIATPVVLDTTETITTIEWTGSYSLEAIGAPFSGRSDEFIVEIYEGAGDGAPDSSTVVQFEVGDGNRVHSGETLTAQRLPGVFFEYPVYDFSADVDFTMDAGKEYWVSIYTLVEEADANRADTWRWGLKQDFTVEESVQRLTWTPDLATDGDDDWRYGGEGELKPSLVYGFDMDFRLRT